MRALWLHSIVAVCALGCAAPTPGLDDEPYLESGELEDRADRACRAGICVEAAPDDSDLALGFLQRAATATGTAHGPSCGVTLVRPDVAITAAHCLFDDNNVQYPKFGVAFGTSNSRRGAPVAEVIVHPSYTACKKCGGESDLRNAVFDMAVLRLATPVFGIAPARIGWSDTAMRESAPNEMCAQPYKTVGYGRIDMNPYDAPSTSGIRKLVRECRIGSKNGNILTASQGADFLCWGDSGSGIAEDTADGLMVHGVLAHFDDTEWGKGGCRSGNHMLFASTAHLEEWLQPLVGDSATAEWETFEGAGAAIPGGSLTGVSMTIPINDSRTIESAIVLVNGRRNAHGLALRVQRLDTGGRVVQTFPSLLAGELPHQEGVPSLSGVVVRGAIRLTAVDVLKHDAGRIDSWSVHIKWR